MPKVKKLKAPALESQQVRHEPLGQVIEGDSQRGSKYAPSTGRRKRRKDQAGEGEFLDEKTSRKILEMSREQQIEEEIDEQRSWHQKNQRQQQQQAQLSKGMLDDSDDDEEDDEIEEIIVDEGDDE